MKDSYKFLIFIIFVLIFCSIGIKKSYYNYKNNSNNPGYISGFYSGVAGIIASVILLILYLLGKIHFND